MSDTKFMTIIEPVQEVTLIVSTQRQAWLPLLADEGLDLPASSDPLITLISLVDSKYMGLRFRELSISVQVRDNRYFLAQAYNAIPAFAFVEQAMFRTPYFPGHIQVTPTHVTLSHGSRKAPLVVFEASLPAAARVTDKLAERNDLVIHLPRRFRKNPAQPHYFFARLEGETHVYPVEGVRLSFTPRPKDTVLAILRDAQFELIRWSVRPAARHSKSKTFFGAQSLAVSSQNVSS